MALSPDATLYENILVNMADGVISIDLEGRIITFNAAAGQILGLTPDAVVGRLYAETFFGGQEYDDFNELVLKAIYESETTHSATVAVSVAGQPRHLVMSTTFLKSGSGGGRQGVIVVFSDITERWERERIERLFGAYLDPRIVERLIKDGEAAGRGTRQEMTILFCDLRGFTRISELLSAEQLIDFANAFFSIMTEPVTRHRGVTDKFIGDSIMAFWGPPFTEAGDHAHLGCRAALEQRSLLNRLRERIFDELGQIVPADEIDLRCGIATGEVVAGSVGPPQSQNYTVIGNAVNLASRLEAASKTLGTPILVSEATGRQAENEFDLREMSPLDVRGRANPERVFELLGPRAA